MVWEKIKNVFKEINKRGEELNQEALEKTAEERYFSEAGRLPDKEEAPESDRKDLPEENKRED